MPVFAVNFDTSIDEDIRRQYNPSKIEQDSVLPALPKILNEQFDEADPPKTPAPKAQTRPQVQPINQYNATIKEQRTTNIPYQYQDTPTTSKENFAVLKTGTRIRLKSLASISDHTLKGTQISFVSKYPVSTTYFTIPKGTTFYGEMIDSHKPQLTGNGGLMVVKVTAMDINGQLNPIDAYITKAHYKYIFRNNIKGERKYFKSMIQSSKSGRYYFRRMLKVSVNLLDERSSAILSPFPFALGAAVAGVNIFVSPVLAVFYKGGNIYIPSGSDFEIKIDQDCYIYN